MGSVISGLIVGLICGSIFLFLGLQSAIPKWKNQGFSHPRTAEEREINKGSFKEDRATTRKLSPWLLGFGFIVIVFVPFLFRAMAPGDFKLVNFLGFAAGSITIILLGGYFGAAYFADSTIRKNSNR